MKRSREQLEAELKEEMSALIDEYLDWHEETEQPTFTDIEEEVLELRERMSVRMAEVVAEDQEATRPVEPPRCPECGEVMRNKGGKKTTIGSRVGEVRMRRGYYYCTRCQTGSFPPG